MRMKKYTQAMAAKVASDMATSYSLERLNELHKQQLEWTEKHYKPTNDALLKLLTGCLEMCQAISLSRKLSKALTEKLIENKITFNDGTDLSTKVVRYVFRIESKRVFTYSRVLRIAMQKKVNATAFAAWVTDQGGIEDVSSLDANGVSASKRRADKVRAAADILATCDAEVTLAENAGDQISMAANAEYEFALALVRRNATTGALEIVRTDNSISLIKAFLDRVGDKVVAEDTSQRSLEATAVSNTAASAVIDKIAANAKAAAVAANAETEPALAA
jgi:hypothetical protein